MNNQQQRQQTNYGYNHNSSYQKPISNVSQIQNTSSLIKPITYPCRYHPDQWCQNYCIEPKCFQVLCAQCIQEHLLHHKKTGLNDLYVKSFRSVRGDCSVKLIKIIEKLLSKLGILQQPKNPQEMIEDVDQKLETIRLQMHQLIDQQFIKIRQAIKSKVSESFTTIKDLNEIHQNLVKIINQLKEHNTIVTEGIIDHNINVTDSIQKTIMLNQNALFDMFQKQSTKYDQKMRKIDMEIMYNQGLFKQGLIQSLKLGNSSPSRGIDDHSYVSKNTSRSRSRSPINDRSQIMHKGGSILSFNDNNLQVMRNGNANEINYPVIHYFQTGTQNLHLIDLKNGQKNTQHLKIPLDDFVVPNFHASIISQRTGAILISGGNVELVQQSTKSRIMSKFSLVSNNFKRQYAVVKPRSSHTLCEDYEQECVYVLGGYGQIIQGDNQQSLSTYETTVQKVNLKNGSVTEMRKSKWGGANMAIMSRGKIIKACQQGIQVYDTYSNTWTPIQNIQSSYSYNEEVFCRASGYGLIQNNSILIYGGYNDKQQGKNDCFLMNFNLNSSKQQYSVEIKKINATLPISEGFWNNPGIIVQGSMYAVQNVQDDDGQPVQSQRHLLKFDLEDYKWTNVKINKKRN